MAKALSEDILNPLKLLIVQLSGLEEGTDPFNHILKHFKGQLRKHNIMFFLNKKEIDNNIDSMCEKFSFHGFFPHAKALQKAYALYIPDLLPKAEMMNRLNFVKFLLCMSESPTKYFLDHPDMIIERPVEAEAEIDWVAYLNEGNEKWNINFDVTSDDESHISFDDYDRDKSDLVDSSDIFTPKQIRSEEKFCTMDLRVSREELKNVVQHSWYNEEYFHVKPESIWREANMGLLWEKHLENQAQGLIMLKQSSIISEYKVIREILWQMWSLHRSTTLELRGNSIKPRPDVTLASVRTFAFYTFVNKFIPYMELLEFFREFEKSVDVDLDQNNVCRTYQSYCNCLRSLIEPIYRKLRDLEDEIRKQKTTYTLLKLANDFKVIFNPLLVLKEIHDEVALPLNFHSPLDSATTMICKLHESLHFTDNKLKQDLKLTMFLESIRFYLDLVNSWLIKGDFADYSGEFVIEKTSKDDKTADFVIKNSLNEQCKNNSFMKIFWNNVYKVGKNIDFLRLLGKYDVLEEYDESLYDEFISDVFIHLTKFGKLSEISEDTVTVDKDLKSELIEDDTIANSFIFPVIGSDVCKTNPDMQTLEHLVDVDDGFLMTAFGDFFIKTPVRRFEKSRSLFDRISCSTKTFFPKANFFEPILTSIIEKRFTVSGLVVKNILIEEHLLEKQFEFLKYLYMFYDDLIFPFYVRLFEKTDSSRKHWANDIWLTSHLQDLFMDIYPELYETCSVHVKENYAVCTDSLYACNAICVNVALTWPLNMIMPQQQIGMYQDVFQFLLKLKWALHTVNRLAFSDLGSMKTSKKLKNFREFSHTNQIAGKLICLKFCIINVLNSLQHYVFNFVFGKNVQIFELQFEKASDLGSLIESHKHYIESVHLAISDLHEKLENTKNSNILHGVRLLKQLWNDVAHANPEKVEECTRIHENFCSDISPIIFPVHIYDY